MLVERRVSGWGLMVCVSLVACAPSTEGAPQRNGATSASSAAGTLSAAGGSVAAAGSGGASRPQAGSPSLAAGSGSPSAPTTPPPGVPTAGRAMGSAGRSGGAGRASLPVAGAPGTGAAGTAAPVGSAGTSAAAGGGAVGTGEFEAERQACVDTINMYRAMLNLMPLKRGTPEQEACSDMGAKKDGDSNMAHSSAGSCRGLGAQNTCPGYPVRNGSTLTATLNGCLAQMWAEGEPAEGVQACIQDRTGCFQAHGHWINMSQSTYGTVACGFYKMANGRYWMNQNFGR